MKTTTAIFGLFLLMSPVRAQEIYSININRVCAAIVDIPYASDNFSDEEWEQFKNCLEFMRNYRESQ
jgi:hypothetical protein